MNSAWASHFLEALGRVSAQAAVLALMVLLAQWLFRRWLTPRWRCALWFVVMARLLLPISLPTKVSVFNLAPRVTGEQRAPANADKVSLEDNRRTEPVPFFERGMSAAPAVSSADPTTEPPPAVEAQTGGPETVPAATRVVASNSASSRIGRVSWPAVLFALWLAGAAFLVLHVIVNSVRVARRFRGLPEVTDAAVLAVLDECRRRMRLPTRLRLVEGRDVRSPALHGVFRPRLLLPAGFTRSFSPSELHFVFLHELAHVKRKDVLVNWLVALLQIAHWFNPFVWYGFARWRADRELACDALALETAGAGCNKEYGRTILRLLEGFTHGVAAPGLVGIMEDRRQLQQRIGMIAAFTPTRRWSLLAAALLTGLAAIGLTDAQTPRATPAPVAGSPSSSANLKVVPPRELRRGLDPLPTADQTNLPAHTMTMIVLDAESGQPIADAEVFAPGIGDMRKPEPRRLTDSFGRFVLQIPLPAQETRARISNLNFSTAHPDYAPRAAAWTSSGGDVYSGLPKEVTLRLERGVAIGGLVRDAKGAALAGVKILLSGSGYRGFSMGTGERKDHEYAQVHRMDPTDPAAVTDSNGRWTFAHYPSELEKVEITLLRPDDSREAFSTSEDSPLNARPVVPLQELKAQTATFNLRGGLTVRGRVLDENGRPIAGATVKEGYGHGNIQRISEFTTPEDGRFERLNRAPRQWIYTASAPGRATVSVVPQVEASLGEVRIVLPAAKPIRLHLVDEDGKPIANTALQLDTYRNEAQLLDWEGLTDADGRVVWTNAPTAPVTIYALGSGRARKFKVSAADAEQEIVLRKNPLLSAQVHLKAYDREKKNPVRMQSVSANINGDYRSKVLATPEASEYTAEIRLSDVTVGNYATYTVTVSAEGYEPFTSRQIDLDEGDQTLEVPFNRMNVPSQVVLRRPDGTPAGGARVWVRPNDNAGAVFANAPDRYYGDRWEKAQANAEGEVKLPAAPRSAALVITDTNGFLETTLGALGQAREIKLQARGRIEGRALVAGQPKGGVTIYLADLVEPFHLIYQMSSRDDGSFEFDRVPPGDYTLYRRHNKRMGTITPSHQMPITIKPGETLKVDYGSNGRAVLGQAMADPPGLAANWLNDTHVLSLKTAARKWGVNREDYATFEAFRAANAASFTSNTRREGEQQARDYELVFDQDGGFHIDDVPPGTYELRIRITKPNERGRFGPTGREEELGALIKVVIVPAGDGPFDLGSVDVLMKGGEPVRSGPAIGWQAQTLDGKEVKLADFRGKVLLVSFWAAWTQRSSEHLAELNKLQSHWSRDDRIAFLSLNLDDDMPTAVKASKPLANGWQQARLEGQARADVTAAFNVETLPAIFLFDRDGRVVGRDLEGERARVAVERALKKK